LEGAVENVSMTTRIVQLRLGRRKRSAASAADRSREETANSAENAEKKRRLLLHVARTTTIFNGPLRRLPANQLKIRT